MKIKRFKGKERAEKGSSNSSNISLADCDITYRILYFALCNEMVYQKNISPETKAFVRFLRHEGDLTVQEIVHRCGISWASVYRCIKKCNSHRNTRLQRGRPRLINERKERII